MPTFTTICLSTANKLTDTEPSWITQQHVTGKGIGPESQICIDFANWCRNETKAGRLRCVWFHIPNEGRRSMRLGKIMRAMGLAAGAPDYVFIGAYKTIAIEVKAAKGRLSDNQLAMQEWFKQSHVNYFVAWSYDECIQIIKKNTSLYKKSSVVRTLQTKFANTNGGTQCVRVSKSSGNPTPKEPRIKIPKRQQKKRSSNKSSAGSTKKKS